MDLKLAFLVVIVKDPNRTPYVFFVFINWRESVSLVRSRLAVIDPLFDGLVLFPCVIAGECLHTWDAWITVEDFVLFLKDLECLLGGFVLCGISHELLEEGFFSNDRFVLFYDISMSRRKALF